jgi:phosphoribosylformimino-5-aminoimidazole carboxamide ribotide isomerase
MMEVIPAIDIIDGKCVRLTQGDYSRSVTYNSNPLEVALQFEAAGIKRLHLVDLDGAKASHIVNHRVLRDISTNTKLRIDFGGGVKTDKDIAIAFDNGAAQVTAGSVAVSKPDVVIQWLQHYGAERIILGADVKNGEIATHGWQQSSGIDLFAFLQSYMPHGLQYVICTDVAKDGMMQGSSIDLYKQVLLRFPSIKLIASGGVNSIADLQGLQAAGLHGAIVGKAIYEGAIQLHELTKLN